MNIRGGNKHRIEIKKQKLKEEIAKGDEGNKKIIIRLKESIKRNERIAGRWRRRRRLDKIK